MLVSSTAPKGWGHPRLGLHRRWHARLALRWRARLAAAGVAVAAVLIAFGLSPWWVLLGLAAALVPPPLRRDNTLRDIERRYGSAYTTALAAPDDEFGLRERLEVHARTVAGRAELPDWPWVEFLLAVAVVTLALALRPAAPRAATAGGEREVAPVAATAAPDAAGSTAAPVLESPASGRAPDGGDRAASGRAASGGTPTEGEVGAVRSGGGAAKDDPAAVSREFLEALERGAVNRSEGGSARGANGGPSVEDLNPDAATREGASGGDRQGGGDASGRGQDASRAGDQGKNAAGSPGANGKAAPKSGQGQQGAGQSGPDAAGNDQGGASSGQKAGGSGQGGAKRNPFDRGANADDGQFGQGGNAQGGGTPSTQSEPGRGGRNAGGGVDQSGAGQGQGKLEYLPGVVSGSEVRSGALQLPGDPKRPFTLTPGSPAYERAVEGAVLDPRLPPEYRDLLKNYYR